MPPGFQIHIKKRTNSNETVSSEKQSRFHGQAPPLTTGWKVQNPPSAGVLRRDRSSASASASSRLSGARLLPDSSLPGLSEPGPATQTALRTSSRSECAILT